MAWSSRPSRGSASSPQTFSFRQGSGSPTMLPPSPSPLSRMSNSFNSENPWLSVYRNSGLAPVFQRGFTHQAAHRPMATSQPTTKGAAVEGSRRESVEGSRRESVEGSRRESVVLTDATANTAHVTYGGESAMVIPRFDPEASFAKSTRTVSSLSDYYYERVRGQTAGSKRLQNPVFNPTETGSTSLSGYDTARTGSQRLGFTITAETTLEEAEQILNDFKTKRLDPPKAYWEEPDARQKVIAEVEKKVKREYEPGGSWVAHAGDVPASRSLPKNPDKVLLDPKMTRDRRRMLTNLRWQFHVSKMSNFRVVMDHFQANSGHEKFIPIPDFLALLKEIQFELTTDREYNLIAMFKARGSEMHIDFERFTYQLFDATEGELQIPSEKDEVDPRMLAILMRQSTAFDDLNMLRPRSRSGREYNLHDVHQQYDRPLVLPSGTQKTPSKIQFLSDREQLMYETRKHEMEQRKPTVEQELTASVSPKGHKRNMTPKLQAPPGPQSPNSKAYNPEQIEKPGPAGGAADSTTKDVSAPPSQKQARSTRGAPSRIQIPPPIITEAVSPQPALPPVQIKSPSRSPQYRLTVDGVYRKGSISVHKDLDGNPLEENLEKPRPFWRKAQAPHAPNWSLVHRTEVKPADMSTKISHISNDGQHLAHSWESTNLCNKELPEEQRRKITVANMQEQKKNASKRDVNWSYSHSGAAFNPSDWSSTTRDQQQFLERARTPKKWTFEPGELREPPWSVAERHLVHLQQYDHKIVGLKRPEPLAGKS